MSAPPDSVSATALRKTALNGVHRRLGAKMVDFGGWDMPVEYSGITAEHMAVRTAVGLFDVSIWATFSSVGRAPWLRSRPSP